MAEIAIVTDSNSGITRQEAEKLGIFVVPMPFYIDGELYLEEITLSQEEFYQKLSENAEISTSQPAPGELIELWERLLDEYEEIVYIPMSSSLSSSCETAIMLSEDYDGRVQVVNNQRISVTQKQSVMDALTLAKAGKTAMQIKEQLEEEKRESSIYITVDTLKYLKKGGRVTPAAAAIGTVLNLKPVLMIQGGKLDAFSKARGWKQAKKTMLTAMEEDLKNKFAGKEMRLHIAYTCSEEEKEIWKQEVLERFPGYEVNCDKLSLSVACHIGHGAMAIACSKPVSVDK